jgi:hypothetical protein
MRYVFYAFAFAVAAMVWVQTSEKGRTIKRHLAAHPVDPLWSH